MPSPPSQQTPGDLLPLPSLNDQSGQQQRGIACVWCAVTLAADTAVDLGPRPVKFLGDHVIMYPRGCHTCVAERLPVTQQRHVAGCEQCVDNPAGCNVARALRHLEMTVTR